VPESLISYCLRPDSLERNRGDLVLSSAGRAWLRRHDAGDDAFREQHQLRTAQLKEIDGIRRPVLVNETESPLGWVRSRRDRTGRPFISDPQYEAGERSAPIIGSLISARE
jgi:Domain of unknown function (DUF6456)